MLITLGWETSVETAAEKAEGNIQVVQIHASI